MFAGPLSESILGRAQGQGIIDVRVHDIREWTHDRHRTADDTPYGGGAGMVLKAPPIIEAVEDVLGVDREQTVIVLLSASGRQFTQSVARELSAANRIALICGRYEGVDARVPIILHAEEVSVGDYVLTGGELPAMVVVDSVARLVPGVIEDASTADESFDDDLLEYPQFTRPVEFRGHRVPDVLLSGHHANVDAWRREQAIARTKLWRPDLLQQWGDETEGLRTPPRGDADGN